MEHIRWFKDLRMTDVDTVGGKNASLGEMIGGLANAGVNVPDGFATTAEAFTEFLQSNDIEARINKRLEELDIEDVAALATTGAEIRGWVNEAQFSPEFEEAINQAYIELQAGNQAMAVAVRSSATAEDLPDASFAGQQETFLNIRGIDSVKSAIKEVFASLYNDRAISYRVHKGFEHSNVALSAGIQRMVRSETGSAGVMFTMDTESGFDDVVFITSSYGLGETVVQGSVNPDEFYVRKQAVREGCSAVVRRNLGSKLIKMVYASSGEAGKSVDVVDVDKEDQSQFSLSDNEVTELASQALIIEEYYQRPMDIEWAKDGDDGHLYIVQARPETVKSRDNSNEMERYLLKGRGNILCEGRSIGHRIGAGPVKVIDSIEQMAEVQAGDVLVTDMTDPDWEPVMKRAAAIVTNRGGRTCHAAIIARELGIPAVVGCGDATKVLATAKDVTVSCAEGETGFVYDNLLEFDVNRDSVEEMPELPFSVLMNVGNPDRAFTFHSYPNQGVGLARLEFIINRMIGVHPKALLELDELDSELQQTIRRRIAGYSSPRQFFVDKLVEGVATIATAFYPKKVIVRMSDFKSNEYAHLIGGNVYEPNEENPMLGFRGASRYVADSFSDCFAMECEALRIVREDMKLTNVEIMVPFVRTVGEARQSVQLLDDHGLKRGENNLRVIMMCELPANALLAEQFLEHFDGFSIGSNDLTQLTLGLDRDSGLVAHLFDERNDAVKALLSMAIQACKKADKYIGICGQGPSDHPDFARWLMEQGIDSISLNPDSVLDTWVYLGENLA